MTKSTDTAGGILAGYQFTRNWGAEAFYTGVGKSTAQDIARTANINSKADAFGVVGTGTLPLSDAFSLYGKLGYASVKTTVSCTAVVGGAACGALGPSNATRGAATYGLGGVYNATSNIGIRLGWDRFAGAVTNPNGAQNNYNANVYSLAGVFQF